MNIPCVNDDEDFPVFKAGPPLPIRTKSKPNCKIKGIPLKATSTISPKGSSKQGNSSSQAVTNSSVGAESKVKLYIEKVKARDEIGRKKRIKPEQMLSLEELYQVNVASDTIDKHSNKNCNKIKNSAREEEQSLSDVHDKLRETLRIVKEKDELINKLRESCHDLAIKCADAENRVDELRFSYGRSSNSVCNDKDTVDARKVKVDLGLTYSSAGIPRRCVSDEGLNTCGIDGQNAAEKAGIKENISRGKVDKATETRGEVMKYDAHTQIETAQSALGQYVNERLAEQDVGQWNQEDDILQETCSNWLEKVQNWKTDSTFNLSQDSCGDKDSGFRGSSAEIDAESVMKQRHPSFTKSLRKSQSHGERLLKLPYSQKNCTAQVPQTSSSSTATITATQIACCIQPRPELQNEHSMQQHFWPSFSSSQSHFQLNSANFSSDSTKAKSLFYEMAEADRNKYVCFQEECPNKKQCHSGIQQQRLFGTKSLDALYIAPETSQPTMEELKNLIDSSFDPPEFILKSYLNSQHRSVDKKMKILGPLLDDTTQIALRVKMKSERLAKMLSDACTLE